MVNKHEFYGCYYVDVTKIENLNDNFCLINEKMSVLDHCYIIVGDNYKSGNYGNINLYYVTKEDWNLKGNTTNMFAFYSEEYRIDVTYKFWHYNEYGNPEIWLC